MIATIIYAVIFLVTPAFVIRLCRNVSWAGKIGPVLILYVTGILIGNIGSIPFVPQSVKAPFPLLDALSTAMIPLAIPLMLFVCTFRKSDTRDQLLALITGLFAVVVSVIIGYLIFGKDLEEGTQIAGMLTGVYTGGTINMASLKTMLGVREEVFILLNTYDMIISFFFLTFLMSVGIKLFRKFLPVRTFDPDEAYAEAVSQENSNPYKALLTKDGRKDALILVSAALVIVGISAGIALLVPDNAFMVVFILVITTLGIVASFWPYLREKSISYDIGMYLIYVFSMVVAAMADLSSIDWLGSLNMLGYLAVAVFGSMFIQVVLAWALRIDSDTMVISSVAFVNSPPFVPMICGAMHNRRVLVSGLSIGIVGYAVGNYLGFLISKLLTLI